MEAQEEAIMETRETTHQIIKGKRTKRPRPLSPPALTMAVASSSSSSVASPTSSAGFETNNNTEEEEDMAKCLILLAQGQLHDHHHRGRKTLEPLAAAAAANNVHQCKTCNRSFASFQALGGHRASHKKPKANNNVDDKKMLSFVKEEQRDNLHDQFLKNTTLSLQVSNRSLSSSGNNNKSKVHECSICGAEFSSGQALGGHMRRHRTLVSAAAAATTTTTTGTNLSVGKTRNILELDLNLPAPEDDRRETKFPFAAKEQVIVFSTSPLVDCHY